MTKRTTNDWEALLDGTTEGPWKWHWDEGILDITDPNGEAIALDVEVKDSDLIAAAPEAVAEVVRLRQALEEMKTEYKEMSKEEFRFGYERSGLWHGDVARHLTRILEGHNDE